MTTTTTTYYYCYYYSDTASTRHGSHGPHHESAATKHQHSGPQHQAQGVKHKTLGTRQAATTAASRHSEQGIRRQAPAASPSPCRRVQHIYFCLKRGCAEGETTLDPLISYVTSGKFSFKLFRLMRLVQLATTTPIAIDCKRSVKIAILQANQCRAANAE